jgi:hypothetical protein
VTPEDRLRQAIEARTSRVEPSAGALQNIEEKLMDAQQHDNRKRLLIGLGAAAAIAAVVVGAVVLTGDDDDPVVSEDTTTTSTTESTTTTTESTTTTTTGFQTVDPAVPVFPDPTTSQRFESPEAVALAFITDLVGFTNPVMGEFAQGDTRSGEIEARPFADGAPTTVLVRQLEDDTWFVIGATTDSIRLATPASGDTIGSPQPLTGMAYAFEGTVDVRLYVDGTQEPVGETFVTGRGDGVLGDFEGALEFTNAGGATHGTLVLTSGGGEDGAPIAAQVIRVGL